MCEDIRTALSARLDGEEPGLPDNLVNTHLVGCAACQGWHDGARRVVRALRTKVEPPDLTDSIMTAVEADPQVVAQRVRLRAAAEAHGRRQVLRVAVAVAAVVQLGLALPTLFSAFAGSAGVGLHASREMASFDVAVAVGFLIAAYRPQRALAYVPVALVLAACLALTSGVDLSRGVTVPSHEVGHLVAVVQAGLLWALGRIDRAHPPTGTSQPGTAGSPLVAAE